jgi:SAM-dependent methyltransferase
MSASAPVSTDDWNRHWSAFADATTLNPAQAYRRMLVFRALNLNDAHGPVRLLEVGSGQGDLSREIKDRHPEVELVGLDLSHTGVEIARSKVPSGTFFQQDLTRPLALPDRYHGWATHAVCSEVLEHLDDPRVALNNIRACLAPGGRLVITVPSGPMSAFDRHIGHRAHFSPERLEQVLRDTGLGVESLYGAGFPFFNLYRLTVIARGKKLIDDADVERQLPVTARAAMRVFGWLFRWNKVETRLGWQLVATAVEPSVPSVLRSSASSLS